MLVKALCWVYDTDRADIKERIKHVVIYCFIMTLLLLPIALVTTALWVLPLYWLTDIRLTEDVQEEYLVWLLAIYVTLIVYTENWRWNKKRNTIDN